MLVKHVIGFVKYEHFNMTDIDNLNLNKWLDKGKQKSESSWLTNFAPYQIRHGSRSSNNYLRSDIGRISRQVIFDGVFSLNIGKFSHGCDNRHNLTSKFS